MNSILDVCGEKRYSKKKYTMEINAEKDKKTFL